MTKDEYINIPILEAVKRSFYFVFNRALDCFKAASFWYILIIAEVLLGYPTVNGGVSEGQNLIVLASSVLVSLASAGIATEICRNIISKDNDFSFFKPVFTSRSLRYWLYNILIIFTIFIPFVIVMYLSYFLVKQGLLSSGLFVLLQLVVLCAVSICACRLYLMLPAQAINDTEMSLQKSWHLTRGCGLKIFGGLILVAIPGVALSIILGQIASAIPSFSDSHVLQIIFTFLAMSVSFFDACLKASFLSHLYQYYMYYADKDASAEQ